MTTDKLKPSKVGDHLELLRKGLTEVKKKAPAEWSAKEVLKECEEGKAFLFVSSEGFCILKPNACPPAAVHIWIAYGESSSNTSLISKYNNQVEQLARAIGATRLTFNSTRKGYRRLLKNKGWKLKGNQYERQLT